MTRSHTEPGQMDISCKFLVNSSVALGYLATVYSHDNDVHYLISENLNEEYINASLNGLSKKEYSALLFTINDTGLPLEQPASYPNQVFIDDNPLDFSGMYLIAFINNILNYYIIV